jgi:hypothetical protein
MLVDFMESFHCRFRDNVVGFCAEDNLLGVELAHLADAVACLELSAPVVGLDVVYAHLPLQLRVHHWFQVASSQVLAF